jgi:exosortase/archaeosortase family protein
MDLGDLELRGILARKSKLFLRLDCSCAWLGVRRAQINPRAKRKYRASNIGSPDLVNCFFWNCRDRDILRARIRARASLASDHRHLGDRIHSNYSHAPRCWFAGGKTLLLAELFPVLFFLTAVPWPPRFEQPITAGLMQAVTAGTTVFLHWFGIPAQTTGGAITLRTGVVGITEACSGMRSLQAGIMFGLAMGEWFLLRPFRRITLLFIAIALALTTNFIRTLPLSLQAEWHGLDAVEKIHDLTARSRSLFW